jgi:hypothetical protein
MDANDYRAKQGGAAREVMNRLFALSLKLDWTGLRQGGRSALDDNCLLCVPTTAGLDRDDGLS